MDTVKPVQLIKFLISTFSTSNDIIVDFFSGSATTGQAVLELNVEEEGKRKYILVQLPELIDVKSEAFEAGFKTVFQIGKERILGIGKAIIGEQQALLAKKQEELAALTQGRLMLEGDEKVVSLQEEIVVLEQKIANLDTGFRVHRLADSNMQDVYYRPHEYRQEQLDLFADNVKPDRTPDDLLAQVMLDWGLPLSLKIEQLDILGKRVFKVAENSLYACFDRGIDEEFAKAIAKEQPLRVVFRDSGFTEDSPKVNVRQLLKQLSPETEMKVI